MKKIIFLSLTALISIGCGNSAPTTTQNNTITTAATPKKDDTQPMVTHSSETQKLPAPPSNVKSDAPAGNPPMQKAVDVTAMTTTIEKAEKDYKAKSTDANAKEVLATAYFTRAFALTDAAQYSAALGDFRKGLKLNPDDKKAKDMHDQIVGIYEGMGRPVPKEGEEKAPMVVK
jgi:TolA-binding protein